MKKSIKRPINGSFKQVVGKPTLSQAHNTIEKYLSPTKNKNLENSTVEIDCDNLNYVVLTSDSDEVNEICEEVFDGNSFAKDSAITCIVCNESLSNYSQSLCESHIRFCLSKSYHSSHLTHDKNNENLRDKDYLSDIFGIESCSFFCVLCDIDLSKKCLLSRCLHLKSCAKKFRVLTKELLKLIAPIHDDINDICNDEVIIDDNSENCVKPEGSIANNTKFNEDNICIPKKKNAWDIMMASSKLLSKNSKSGGFESLKLDSAIMSSTKIVKTTDILPKVQSVNHDVIPENKRFKRKSEKTSGVLGYAPAYKKIQFGNMRVPIIVDGFQYSAKELSDTYFLTHFHSDHYTGLTSDFDSGIIYCSPTTAGLVKLRLRVQGSRIIPLELDKKHVIGIGGEDVEVTLTDANHCPGAVIILFQFQSGKKVLHTGDFRWNRQLMLNQQSIKSLVYVPKISENDRNSSMSLQKCLTIYLDTTYCDPTYDFPPQDIIIDAVVECMKKEIKDPNALFLFGAYSIGKERVYMAVAKTLKLKVYVEKYRWKAMLCYDWPIEDQAVLTTNQNDTNIWVVPMNHISFQNFQKIIENNNKYNKIIGFQPTGWVHPTTSKVQISSNQTFLDDSVRSSYVLIPKLNKTNNNKIYSLPYSEHSSFTELVDCLKILRPQVVIPTVNTSESKVKEQLELLREAAGIIN